MNVTFGSYQRCLKNFKPLQIVAKFNDKNNSEYWILDKNQKFIGKFDIWGSDISGLCLDEKVRRKKTAVNAILSIRDFILKKAKENNLDFVTLVTEVKEQHNMEKLYKHLGAEYIGKDTNGEHFIGIVNSGKKALILEQFNFLKKANIPIEKFKKQVTHLLGND